MLTLSDLKPRDRVLYVPTHANGNVHHRDVEAGAVSSVGIYVFVKFDQHVRKFGWDGAMSQGCDIRDLVKPLPGDNRAIAE